MWEEKCQLLICEAAFWFLLMCFAVFLYFILPFSVFQSLFFYFYVVSSNEEICFWPPCSKLVLFDYTRLHNITFDCTLFQHYSKCWIFPYSNLAKQTKYWTKVIICGNSIHTKVMSKGITNIPSPLSPKSPFCVRQTGILATYQIT